MPGYLGHRDIAERAIYPDNEGLLVENAFAGALAVGTLVYVSTVNTTAGATLGIPKVTKADADGATPSNEATYVVVEAIAQSGFGRVARGARVLNVNTSAYTTAGDPVYLSTTAGTSTPTDPSIATPSANRQRVGYVSVKSSTVGEIIYDLRSNTVTKLGTSALPQTGVQYAEVSLTNAQILALATTPVQVVAAQGAGTVIEFISGALFFDYTAAYTEPSAPDDIVVRYTDGSGGVVSQDVDATNFLTATADAMAFIAPQAGAITLVRLKTAVDNAPLVLHNTGADYGGGNAANAVRAKVAYRVHAAGW